MRVRASANFDLGQKRFFATAAPPEEKVRNLTFGSVDPAERAASRASWTAVDVFVSGVVLALIAAAYLYFTG